MTVRSLHPLGPMTDLRIGVSGWSYDPWRKGAFYPEGLARRQELEYAGRRFNSVEVHGSFYSLLRPDTYRKYRESVPEGFLLAVKGSRFITHSKKLLDAKTPLANLFASGFLRLEETLGPVLWQLPEMRWERERVALVFSGSGSWPYIEETTAGFVYLRLHGSPETYASDYGATSLDRWADRIRTWTEGGEPEDAARITDRQPPRRKTRDAYVYFDNDGQAHAPENALGLMERLGVEALGSPSSSS